MLKDLDIGSRERTSAATRLREQSFYIPHFPICRRLKLNHFYIFPHYVIRETFICQFVSHPSINQRLSSAIRGVDSKSFSLSRDLKARDKKKPFAFPRYESLRRKVFAPFKLRKGVNFSIGHNLIYALFNGSVQILNRYGTRNRCTFLTIKRRRG
jgi:hypothetical protein